MKLKLTELIVFQKGVAFDTEGVQTQGFEVSVPTGYSDSEAVKLLNDNGVKRIHLQGADNVSENRISEIHSLLENEGVTYI